MDDAPLTVAVSFTEGPVTLFFYPAALSPGCTAQACHFRDLAAEFAALGARPVGISSDAVEPQAEFAGRHSLGMPLLSDADGTVRERFGTYRFPEAAVLFIGFLRGSAYLEAKIVSPESFVELVV